MTYSSTTNTTINVKMVLSVEQTLTINAMLSKELEDLHRAKDLNRGTLSLINELRKVFTVEHATGEDYTEAFELYTGQY